MKNEEEIVETNSNEVTAENLVEEVEYVEGTFGKETINEVSEDKSEGVTVVKKRRYRKTEEETGNIEEVKEKVSKKESELNNVEAVDLSMYHITRHKFAPGEKAWVPDFGRVRESSGFTKIENSFRFIPLEGEIERVILTESNNVQYKFKNKAGSLYDEDVMCYTKEEAQKMCNEKNN